MSDTGDTLQALCSAMNSRICETPGDESLACLGLGTRQANAFLHLEVSWERGLSPPPSKLPGALVVPPPPLPQGRVPFVINPSAQTRGEEKRHTYDKCNGEKNRN